MDKNAEFARAPNTLEAAIARAGASAVIRAIGEVELAGRGSGVPLRRSSLFQVASEFRSRS
jgi:hypothetical protein